MEVHGVAACMHAGGGEGACSAAAVVTSRAQGVHEGARRMRAACTLMQTSQIRPLIGPCACGMVWHGHGAAWLCWQAGGHRHAGVSRMQPRTRKPLAHV
jgi:hypothetical protein